MLAIVSLALATSPALQNSKVLALRGGMDLGPLNADNVGGFLKVSARDAPKTALMTPVSRARCWV